VGDLAYLHQVTFSSDCYNYFPTSIETVLRAFAISELPRMLDGQPPEHRPEAELFAERFANGSASEADWHQLVARIVQARAPILAFFLYRPTRWFSADYSFAAIGSLRTIAWWHRRQRPSATIAALLENEPDVLLPNFDRAKMRGRPTVVGKSEAGPWYVIDGAHRLCSILNAGPQSMYFGVCPTLQEWSWLPRDEATVGP
jgi:hypothetical protein